MIVAGEERRGWRLCIKTITVKSVFSLFLFVFVCVRSWGCQSSVFSLPQIWLWRVCFDFVQKWGVWYKCLWCDVFPYVLSLKFRVKKAQLFKQNEKSIGLESYTVYIIFPTCTTRILSPNYFTSLFQYLMIVNPFKLHDK